MYIRKTNFFEKKEKNVNLGYIKTATFTPEIKVADVEYNLESIKKGVDLAVKENVKILVFPELCLTGSTAGDLFFSKTLIESAKNAIVCLTKYSIGKDLIMFVGAPIEKDGLLYNACVAISNGVILGVVPKSNLSDNLAVNQSRYFSANIKQSDFFYIKEYSVPFGKELIFADQTEQSLKIAVEVGEDLDAVICPSVNNAINGARIIVNLSAVPEFSGEQTRIENKVKAQSKNLACAYVYANAGAGESTTDNVYSGFSMIAENGNILAKNKPFASGLCTAEIDLYAVDFERRNKYSKQVNLTKESCYNAIFSVNVDNDDKTRVYDKTPFIIEGEEDLLIDIASQGLKKRMEHTGAKTLVLGLSGGLDSTLALITAVRAIKYAGKTAKDVVAITMPCFGTTSRTLDNSIKLAKAFGVTLKKIEIGKSVTRHLKDLNHPIDVHDAAYENAQARERTQVLMDYANMCGGIVVGTGDLSELALGWATYNGDHMSMYAVNASIPKTLVRHLTQYVANNAKGKLKWVLLDILDTPVSPELIPSGGDKIGQVTEDIVGPYVLHDYFLYNMMVCGFTPKKLYHTAVNTFKGDFDAQTILKWLKTFIRRFFSQQFKRSCLPDGPKVTKISLSPRGSYRMPSDAVAKLWLEELENIESK